MGNFSVRPLYLQVRDALAERVASGEWKPNTVPNEMELARELGVSPGTMRKALDLLESEGLVTRRQGRGTFVNDPASPEFATRYDNLHATGGELVIGEFKTLELAEGPVNEIERARLRLDEHDLVCRIRRVRSHMAQAFLAEEVSLPARLFPALVERSDLHSRGVVAIAQAYGFFLGEAVERVSLGRASRAASAALGIAESSPIFILDRIINTRDGQPAEWRWAECMMSELYYEVETT